MSAFDEWNENSHLNVANSAYRQGRNDALDELEGLVDEWDKEAVDMGNLGVRQGHRICGDKLTAKIKQLREQS